MYRARCFRQPSYRPACRGCLPCNERVVCLFDTYRPFVTVLVRQPVVGNMATVWHGTVNPTAPGADYRLALPGSGGALKQGEEMGRFC